MYAGLIAFDEDKIHRAKDCLNRALDLAIEISDMRTCFETRLFLVLVHERLGEHERASDLMRLTRHSMGTCDDCETTAISDLWRSHLMGEVQSVYEGIYTSYLVRVVHRMLLASANSNREIDPGRWKEVMHVETDGRWFQRPGQIRVDLGARDTLRRVLVRLVEARVESPGSALSMDQIFEAGWPDQRIMRSAARNRVYVAIHSLRQQGLDDVLMTSDQGYLINPDQRVQWTV